MAGEMWAEKYRPHAVSEVAGNEEAKAALLSWLRRWKPGSKAALLYGSAGTGKTSLVHALAEEFRYRLIEMNASDARTEEAVMRLAAPSVVEDSLDRILYGYRGNLLFLDEVDGVFGREDRGGVGAIVKIISEARSPVILAANDIQDQRLRPVVRACQTIRLYGIRVPLMMAFLKRICGLEGVEADESALRVVATKSEGDMRSAVNDLQTLIRGRAKLKASDVKQLSFRDRQMGISDTLSAIFTAETIRDALRVERNSQVDPETLVQAVHDNLPVRFSDPLRLAEAYDAVSRADVFFGRIRRTRDWGLLPYAMESLMRGVVSPFGEEGAKLSYRFPPWRWIVLSRTRAVRALRDGVCRRVGERCHVSRRVAGSEYLPYLRIVFQSNSQVASEIASWLRLEEDEIRFISGEKVGGVDRKGGDS